MVLLSPSIRGLQCLLNVCDMYATEHDILYDAKKLNVFVLDQKA